MERRCDDFNVLTRLNSQISCGLAASRLYAMTDAVQVAYLMEEELKKKTSMRASTKNFTRSERTFVDASRSKSIDKPQGSSYVSNKPPCPSASSSSQASSNSNSKTRCFTCHGYGHLSFQCPTKSVAMVERESPKEAKESNMSPLEEDVVIHLMLIMRQVLMI